MVTTGKVDLLYKGGGPNVPTLYLLTGVRAEGGAMSEANKELVRRHFEEIFNRQNLAACDEGIAEDYWEPSTG